MILNLCQLGLRAHFLKNPSLAPSIIKTLNDMLRVLSRPQGEHGVTNIQGYSADIANY